MRQPASLDWVSNRPKGNLEQQIDMRQPASLDWVSNRPKGNQNNRQT